MTDTKISYRIDGRGLAEARRQFQQTFNPDVLKKWNQAARDASNTVTALTKAQSALNAQFKGVTAATTAYKQLGVALQGVAAGYGRVKQQATTYGMPGTSMGAGTPGRVGSAAGAYAAPQAGPPPKMGRFQQGFWQGMAPGIGQLIGAEDRPGAMKQAAGQWAGYGIRRGAGAMIGAASGMFAGQGPLSTMLGNVPFIGGAASQAEAMTGQALQNAQARFQAMPFLGTQLGGGHYEGGTKARTIQFEQLSRDEQQKRRAATDARLQDVLDKANEKYMAAGEGSILDPRSPAYATTQGVLAARQNAAMGKKVIPGTPGKWVDTGYAATGAKIGLGETESIQQATQLARSIGGKGGMDQDRFAQILGAQTMGVGPEAAAGLLRQMQPGRGGQGDKDTLARTIGDAVKLGMENSEIDEYLENISNLQEQASQRGIVLNTDSFSKLATTIGGAGIAGTQASRIAGQFNGAAMNVAGSGVNGPASVLMARAFGYNPGDPNSYINALRKMEGGFTPETMSKFVGSITAGVNDKDQRGFLLQRGLKSAGINVGFDQADRFARGNFSDLPAMPGAPSTAKDLSGRLDSDVVRGLTGSLREQAAIQNQLLAAGKNMLPVVAGLQLSAANLSASISTWAPKLQTYIADPIESLSELLRQLIDMGGIHPKQGT